MSANRPEQNQRKNGARDGEVAPKYLFSVLDDDDEEIDDDGHTAC